jgi:hypothetical protein
MCSSLTSPFQETPAMKEFRELPKELLVRTLEFLETPDLLALRLVSSEISRVSSVCCFRSLKTNMFYDPRFSSAIFPLHTSPLAQMVRAVHIDPLKVPTMVSTFALVICFD